MKKELKRGKSPVRAPAQLMLLMVACMLGPQAWAQQQWLTIAGEPKDAAANYIQLNPTMISREAGLVTIPVRVSRATERTSQDGITFRSFVGVAGVDCKNKTARYLRASFYKAPNFEGTSFMTMDYGSRIRPVAFREIPGDHALRTVRAACTVAG